MAFWSGEKLESDGAKIFAPFEKGQIDCSAYKLRMGAECFVTPDHSMRLRDSKKQVLAAPVKVSRPGRRKQLARGGTVEIPPGQFAFLLTEEKIKVPRDTMGFISLRSHVKWRGLINVSGFHVDPGFEGHLIYSVFNAGPSLITISRGDDIFLLWLASLDQPSAPPYVKSGKPPLVEIPSEMITNVNQKIHSLAELSQKMDSLNTKVQFTWWAANVAAVLLALIIAAWALRPSPQEQTSQQMTGDEHSNQQQLTNEQQAINQQQAINEQQPTNEQATNELAQNHK